MSAHPPESAPSPVLGLLAKQPLPGFVKTRLARATSIAWAAEVADAFLRDTLDRLSCVSARRMVAFSPRASESFFASLVDDRYFLVPQEEGALGERIKAFFREQRDETTGPIILVGTDSPTLPLDFIHQAFAALQTADVVLGPATDGGYYLVGCATALPPIFEDIPWGESSVLDATVARLQDAGHRLALLPPWYDVDTLADWTMLCGHLRALRMAGIDPSLPHVERLIAKTNPGQYP